MTVLDECTELLARLVACPSVNPNRRAADAPPYGEARLVTLLEDILDTWGARRVCTEVTPGRPNLLATFPGPAGGPSIMLEAHTDTVPPDPSSPAPFDPVIRDGRMYGRGSCDTKASIAAMLVGIRRALAEGPLPVTVHFAACCDEELGANGAHRLMRDGFRADACIVGEPTDLAIVHAHKGALRMRIATLGKAAHSSDPSQGVNAIYGMIPVLESLERQVQPALAMRHHPLLGPPTLSVGTIRGGTQVNVVPAECVIEIDRRTIPGESRDAVVGELLAALPRTGIDAEEIEFYPPFETPLDSPWLARMSAACKAATGRCDLATAPWASDAGVFAAAGIPCLLFGPGSIRQAHVADEFVPLDQVATAANVFTQLLRSWA